MRVSRLGTAFQVGFRALVALALAVGVTLLLQRAGTMAMLTGLLLLLTLFFFFALALLDVLAMRRPRRYDGGPPDRRTRRGPRRGPPFFGGLGGVREPSRPFPPGMPPRVAAAEPERAEP